MANIGTIIDGKYEIIAELGRGGMSVVYLAMDRRLNKQWAVKEAKKNPGANSEIFELTPIAEANLLKSLDHPNIVRIVDIIEQNGYIYIVEDFIEGRSLNEEVKKGPSSPEKVVLWGEQLCNVLQYLHTRRPPIIYRDMKPANVQLLTDRETVKLLDFGIAKTYKPQKAGDTYNLGTRGYAAPEQFAQDRQSDARTDIYSLGITLRALLTGKTPYDSMFYEDIRKLNPAVTDGLVKVINKATNQNPRLRYQSAEEFKNALIHYHDYDEAVIRIKKRKLNSFRGLIASSISLLIVGIILLPITFQVKKVDYNDNLQQHYYLECMEIDNSISDAYFQHFENLNSDGEIATADYRDDNMNYLNISDINDKKRFALEVAFIKETSGTTNNGLKDAVEYYEDLAYDFGNPININPTCDLKSILDSSEDIYQAIGVIKTFYSSIYDAAEKNRNSSDTSRNNEQIIKNLHEVNNYVNSHKKEIESDENINHIFQLQDKFSGLGSFYEYIAKSQSDCLIDNRDLFVQNENQDQINDLVSCLNTESEYEKNNSSANSLINPLT